MDSRKEFILFIALLSGILGIITLIEIFNFRMFSEFFLSIKSYAAWFIGITFGFVFVNILNFFRREAEMLMHQPHREEFLFFLLNLIINVFFISVAHGTALYLFNTFFELFHVLFVQWIAVVYICFKLVNKFPISMPYLIAAELHVIAFTVLVLAFVSP